MIHPVYWKLLKEQEKLLNCKNKIKKKFYNGIFSRYVYPVLTKDHVPVDWRYDLSAQDNPYFIERLGVNSAFNPGAIHYDNAYFLMVRIEGTDRKSFFALARSNNGLDHFRFIGEPLIWDDRDSEEVNMYDIRLVKHQDGYIYGIYCSESQDQSDPLNTTSAIAKSAIVRTKDLRVWERLGNIETKSNQQRNVVLHPEFIEKKYAFYTRPQDGFIETGDGGGICLGLCDDICNPIINKETLLDGKRYHTVYEYKNGQGPAPIKTDEGWIHIAHGVRNTAAGLRYVLYAFATSLSNPYEIIAKPSGYLLAPMEDERIGDVSNVVFCNGVIVNDEDEVFIYYASSDTRIHVAKTTLTILKDYVFRNPKEMFRSIDCANQRIELISKNNTLFKRK